MMEMSSDVGMDFIEQYSDMGLDVIEWNGDVRIYFMWGWIL